MKGDLRIRQGRPSKTWSGAKKPVWSAGSYSGAYVDSNVGDEVAKKQAVLARGDKPHPRIIEYLGRRSPQKNEGGATSAWRWPPISQCAISTSATTPSLLPTSWTKITRTFHAILAKGIQSLPNTVCQHRNLRHGRNDSHKERRNRLRRRLGLRPR